MSIDERSLRPELRASKAGGGTWHPDYRFLVSLVRPYRAGVLVALLLMCLQSVAALTSPWLAGRFSAALLDTRPVGALLLLWFAVIALQALLGYAVAVRSQAVASHLVADAANRVFDHLQALPLQWHAERSRGEVLSLLVEDVTRLGYYVVQTLTPLLPLLLTCVGAFVLMIRIDVTVGLAISALLPLLYIALRWVGRYLRPLATREVEAHARKSALAEQNLAMLPVIKAFSGEVAESRRFAAHSDQLRSLELRQVRLQNAVEPVVRVVIAASVLALLWVSSHSLSQGAMTPAQLVTLLLYGLLLTQPLAQLAGVYGQTQQARASAARLANLFAQAPEPDGGIREVARTQGAILFDDVAFAYPGRPALFARLQLDVRPGETVAITGANGAGKSTLVHLLLRLADPDAGRILLDGIDLRELSLRNLRSHIGLVSQHVLLFDASVMDNIRYGNADALREDVERAARAAMAHDFILDLPEGYDTVVGEQGVRLSGGQRQRIALARAMLKDPAVLILDEATAMFDFDAELSFVERSEAWLRGRTVLLITHRPATLALADRVLRLEYGQLHQVDGPR